MDPFNYTTSLNLTLHALLLFFFSFLYLIFSFLNLLFSNCSIPFSTEDIDKAIPLIDPSDIELPSSLSGYSCVQFLVLHQNGIVRSSQIVAA